MRTNRFVTTVAIAILTAVFTIPVKAAQILHLDANAPGGTPSTTWQDLSPSGSHFTNSGSTYNAGNKTYIFDGVDDSQTGSNESLYDFERTDAFSIVVYYRNDRAPSSDSGTNAGITKGTSSVGYYAGLRNADTGRVDVALSNNGGSNRIFHRSPVDQNTAFHMVVITYDGSSDVSGLNVYLDGSTSPLSPVYQESSLSDSILNNDQLRLGAFSDLSDFFKGEIGIVEIWDEELDASYSQTRWNGGDPLRAVPEPGSLAFVGLGLYMLRRRAA